MPTLFQCCTQAEGAQTLDVSGSYQNVKENPHGNPRPRPLREWDIIVVPSGTVTAGTLTVGILPPAMPDDADHQALTSIIDFTAPAVMRLSATVKSFEFTTDSFDGDSFSVYVTAT